MTPIKKTSTNYFNKKRMETECPVTYTIERIGGRWKALIIYNLLQEKKRYGELRRLIPGITEKMLIQQLRQLEEDSLVERTVMPVVPPHVEYSLTNEGRELAPIMKAMYVWAKKYNK
jgi:DNA-binding HxlR family transcriptional regulator